MSWKGPFPMDDIDPQEERSPKRKPLRLSWHDYSRVGVYFITTCVHERRKLLARLEEDRSIPSEAGWIVMETWKNLPRLFPWVSLDEFIVMPDHFHGILWFRGEVFSLVPKKPGMPGRLGEALPYVMRYFKSMTTRKIREKAGIQEFRWQRGYVERIIRNGEELKNIRGYIYYNAAVKNPYDLGGPWE